MDFKLQKECSECSEYDKKKGCKGYQFSVKVQSFYCPKYKKQGEKGNEKQ